MSGRLIQFAASLYPAWWRARYGPEFAALLEDVKPGAGTFVNIVKGALLMQFDRLDLVRSAAACALVGVVRGGRGALCHAAALRLLRLDRESQATDDAKWPEATVPDSSGFTDANLASGDRASSGSILASAATSLTAEILDRFRRDIAVVHISVTDSPGSSPERRVGAAGRPGDAPVSRDRGRLNLSFTYPNGPTAEKVVNALGQIVVVENVAPGRGQQGGSA